MSLALDRERGALLTAAALVPSEYVIGTSTADVLTSLIVSCGRRAALLVPAINRRSFPIFKAPVDF